MPDRRKVNLELLFHQMMYKLPGIYLAGKIDEDNLQESYLWRKKVGMQLARLGFEPIDPLRNVVIDARYGEELSLMAGIDNEYIFQRDLQDIERSIFVLVNLSMFPDGVGTYCEIGYAYAKGISVIGWNPKARKEKISHMFIENMLHQFEDLDMIYRYLATYKNKMKEEYFRKNI